MADNSDHNLDDHTQQQKRSMDPADMEQGPVRKSQRQAQVKKGSNVPADSNGKPVERDIMAEIEAEFLAAPERTQTRDGTKFDPAIDYSDWYIRPVEDGPHPHKTAAEFHAAQKEWRAGLENEMEVREQLARLKVVNVNGEPYDMKRRVIPSEPAQPYKRIMTLIQKYQYEEEPDSEEERELKEQNPDHKSAPNRFTDFMEQREKILKQYRGDENGAGSGEKLVSRAKPEKKGKSTSDDDGDFV